MARIGLNPAGCAQEAENIATAWRKRIRGRDIASFSLRLREIEVKNFSHLRIWERRDKSSIERTPTGLGRLAKLMMDDATSTQGKQNCHDFRRICTFEELVLANCDQLPHTSFLARS
jgi:hypothetical protein